MRLGDLAHTELSRRLAGQGIALAIPPFNVHVRSAIPVVADGLQRLYAEHAMLDAAKVFCDFHIGLMSRWGWRGAQCELDVDGLRPFTPLAREEAFALFEWGLNWCVTSHCHGWITVHAAVLEREGKAVVMPGPPGSGKSTLCAWLMHRGWRLLSDELALIDPLHGHLSASPRPVSLKTVPLMSFHSAWRVPSSARSPMTRPRAPWRTCRLRPPVWRVRTSSPCRAGSSSRDSRRALHWLPRPSRARRPWWSWPPTASTTTCMDAGASNRSLPPWSDATRCA